MRIKENRDSWRANGLKKRDFKHDHSEPVLAFRSTKPTNKWCRGKVGIKHKVDVWHQKEGLFGDSYKQGKCAHCGKIIFTT